MKMVYPWFILVLYRHNCNLIIMNAFYYGYHQRWIKIDFDYFKSMKWSIAIKNDENYVTIA